jgi:hypothetical protein
VEGSSECSNECCGSMKFWETIKRLHNWQALDQCSGSQEYENEITDQT